MRKIKVVQRNEQDWQFVFHKTDSWYDRNHKLVKPKNGKVLVMAVF